MLPGLLDAHRTLRTGQLDEAREHVGALLSPHELRLVDPLARIDLRHNGVRLGSTSLHVLRYGAEVLIDPGVRGDYFLVQLPLAGTSVLSWQSGDCRLDAGSVAVLPPRTRCRMQWSADCEMIMLRVRPDALPGWPSPLVRRRDDPAVAAWCQSVFDLAANIEQFGAAWLRQTAVYEAREHLLLQGLAALARSADFATPADARTLTRVQSLVEAQLHRALTVAEMAEHAFVCPRTLELVFKRNGLPGPLAWARRQRLHQVRSELLRAGHLRRPVSITCIAMAYGFNHMGRFAAQYRDAFGTSPSATLALH